MIATTAYPNIEQYARFDFDELCAEVDKKWNLDPQLIKIDIDEEIIEETIKSVFHITGTFLIEGLEFTLSYDCIDDINEDELIFDELTMYDLHDAYMHRYYESMNMHHDAQYFKDRLDRRGVKASTAIMAAEDDPFADMGFDDEDDDALADVQDSDSISENIDDMADTLDELSDSLKDFEEDSIDIEKENNISDHLIAECEKCHGVFITAVVESDQKIDKISGICPLCDEDCDQYLYWVIKEL